MKHIRYLVFIFSIIFTGCLHTEGILELKGKVLDEKTQETNVANSLYFKY